jgi:hypothetical protein
VHGHPHQALPQVAGILRSEMGDLMLDAVLLAGARGGRNKRHSRRHALRLTLLGGFASHHFLKFLPGIFEILARFF